MDDAAHPLARTDYRRTVTYVDGPELNTGLGEFQPNAEVSARPAYEDAFLEQLFSQSCPEKSGSSGDQNGLCQVVRRIIF
ncbi:MAG: hypothetical protein AMJ59_24940 [Gammaproteobacteria bacterium SG8_31]|nr:MAG: hypothetical protein AMJ59_24940 [Gammaproteobacteria bacterium SG8_31]